jgi:tRNA (cytidine/uridine-2'-O-)-methyltransferase
MRLALFQPDIPQNLGALIRFGACLGIPIDVIEPCGFPLGDRGIRRAALDYAPYAEIVRHRSWESFRDARRSQRLVLLSTKAEKPYHQFDFAANDCLVVGSESAGVPAHLHGQFAQALRIPMRSGPRSLNVALAAAMVTGEALRQIGHLSSLE